MAAPKKKDKVKCTPGCPNKFDETCCRSRGESPDFVPVPIPSPKPAYKDVKAMAMDHLATISFKFPESRVAKLLLDGDDFDANITYNGTAPEASKVDAPSGGAWHLRRQRLGRGALDGKVETIIIHDPVTIAQVKGVTGEGLAYSVGFRTHTETGRRCCERIGCYKPAVRDKGVAKWTRLCAEHNVKRTEAIQASRTRPDCACGNKLPKLGDVCSRCANILAAERIKNGAEGHMVDILKRDVRELVNLALKGEIGYIQGQKALKQVLLALEAFREDGPKQDVPEAKE